MKKKLLGILLTLTMVAGLVAGCGSKPAEETEPSNAASEETEKPADEAEKSEEAEEVVLGRDVPEEEWLPFTTTGEKLTIGLLRNTNVEDYDTNAFTVWLEETTGIDLEFVYFEGSLDDAKTQLALMTSSGEELPDILWRFQLDSTIVNEYGNQGYFLPLNDLYETCGHYIWEAFAMTDSYSESALERYWNLSTDPTSGNIYGIAVYDAPSDEDFNHTCYINQKWLDAVGKEVPTTVDELYDVLVAFRDQDPNGNGQADEIPLLGRQKTWMANICNYIINAFTYFHGDYLLSAENGQIYAPFVTDEYREAMIYLHKLGQEGLLSSLTFTSASHSEVGALYAPEEGPTVVGAWAGHSLVMCNEQEALFEYTALAPLKDATGKGGYQTPTGQYWGWNSFITADCENPELAFKFLDYFTSAECARFNRFGVEGVDYEVVEGTTVDGSPATIRRISAGNPGGTSNWGLNGPLMSPKRAETSTVYEDDGSWSSRWQVIYTDAAVATRTAPMYDEMVYEILYNAEEQEVVDECKSLISDFILEGQAKFATGQWDPNDDGQWQDYLDEMEGLGLSKWLEAAQSAYSRMIAE